MAFVFRKYGTHLSIDETSPFNGYYRVVKFIDRGYHHTLIGTANMVFYPHVFRI
ncbi:MAG: hypothetical protein ACOYU1_01360 [Bacteroidota bacterium]